MANLATAFGPLHSAMTAPEKPLISIALCTYNGARYLRPQLDSLLAQDYPNLEIIAVDDGSTDETLGILEAYSRRDARLKVHRNPVNLGFRRNFEKVIGLCGGSLIATCDQDDVWHPAKLSTLESARQGATLVYCDSELITDSGESIGLQASSLMNMYEGSNPLAFVFGNCISGHAMLFERSLYDAAEPFPQAGYHDWWLAFVAASIGRIRYVDQALVKYRQHESAQTSMANRVTGLRRSRKHSDKLREFADWLQAIQAYDHCPEQTLLRKLHARWENRVSRYFTPDLFLLIFRNRTSLFWMRRESPWRRTSRTWRYLWGLKLKKLFNPRRYVD